MESTREDSCKSQAKPAGEFFSKLTSSALEAFAAIECRSIYAANAVLFTEGESAEALFLVLEGEVRLSINSRGGRRLSMRIARMGDVIGLSSTLSGTPYDMTAETLYPSKIARIERRVFQTFLALHPDASLLVTEELGRQIVIACSQLRNLVLSSSAQQKLARLLLEWNDRGQEAESGSQLRFSLTHEEIGNFIGSSRETVTRTLSDFTNRHLVAIHGSMMTIPNRAALADYAHA
jgi:CRP/FNR family transcriptional regulator, cyclic AMP receptor protein